MEKYESKHQQILRSAEQIYTVISRFDNLTPAVQDKVEEWRADENSCSFKVKGFTVNLQIVAKEAPKYVKIQSGEDGVPIDFTFWIQLQPAGPYDTRMRLVLHAELNMMMRMMIGGKLQKAQIVAKEAPKYVKIQSGEDGVPIDFTFWIQLQPAGPYDTRMRLVLHAELNMMMRMMIGGKLQKALDQIAEAMAKAMNGSAM